MTGSSAVPACSGVYPAACWSWMGSRNIAPPTAAYTANVTALATENRTEANTPSGSIGAACCHSHPTNAISSAAPTSRTATGNPDQPWAAPWMRPYVRPASPTVTSAAPGRSTRPTAPGARDSGTWRRVTRTTAAASGRFT